MPTVTKPVVSVDIGSHRLFALFMRGSSAVITYREFSGASATVEGECVVIITLIPRRVMSSFWTVLKNMLVNAGCRWASGSSSNNKAVCDCRASKLNTNAQIAVRKMTRSPEDKESAEMR